MKKILLITLICSFVFQPATAQKQPQLNETSVVKDTVGNLIPFDIWSQLLLSGRFNVKFEKKDDSFIFVRLTDEEYEKRLISMPKPKESNFFKTGTDFKHFKTKTLEGDKIDTKSLVGKTIVINFWFINCPPCLKEIPDLNILADSYKSDSNVVFIAVALDQKDKLNEFLKTRSFSYKIIDDGRFITDKYRINSYPTNLIVNPDGKIYFHSTGFGANTVYWLKKSIEELKQLKQSVVKKIETSGF